MTRTAYRLLGLVVWRALKWYIRERLPSRRRIVLSIAVVLAGAATASALLRRRAA